MKNFINAFLHPFRVIKLERQLSEIISDLNSPSFKSRDEIKETFKALIHKTHVSFYPIIVDRIVPSTSLAFSLKNIVDDNDFFKLVENLPNQYFENKKVGDFLTKLSLNGTVSGPDVKFDVLLLLIEHYEKEDKKTLINACNEILFKSVFGETVPLEKTIKSKNVEKWKENHTLPLNPELFWKHVSFYLPRQNESVVELLLSRVEKAMSLCQDTLPTFEKYLLDYKDKIETAPYRQTHIQQKDLNTVNEYLIKNVMEKEYDLLDNSLTKPIKATLKHKL